MKPQKYFTLSESDLAFITAESFGNGARFIQLDETIASEFSLAVKKAMNDAKESVLTRAEKAQNINRILQECNL